MGIFARPARTKSMRRCVGGGSRLRKFAASETSGKSKKRETMQTGIT